MGKLGRKHQVLIVAILIILPIFLFSYPNASSSWHPRAFGDPTPIGIIHAVNATPDSKILVGIEVENPSTKYIYCQIILIPPGHQGGNSSGQAKLLKINDQGIESYNETIRLEILPSDPSEHLNFTTNYIKLYDSLVINCSILGHIPAGRWIIFLMYFEGPITSATWMVNDTSVGNHSLSFTGTGVADPMIEYGFVHNSQYGDFWTALFFFSAVTLTVLIVGLYSSLKNDKKDKSP